MVRWPLVMLRLKDLRARRYVRFDGIVSERRDLPYQSSKSKRWLKIKNPNSPAMTRLDRAEKLSMRPSDARLSFTVESDGPICFPPSEAVSRSDDRAADCCLARVAERAKGAS